MKSRNISSAEVMDVIQYPDEVLKETCKSVFQKKILKNNSLYLYRVFINTCKDPELIITVYKTSKIEKYEN